MKSCASAENSNIHQILHQSQASVCHICRSVIAANISLLQRASHVCWWSPWTSLTKAKLIQCQLPTAKEILVITWSFLNIIKHRPFHHCKCVTFRFTASLSVTDRSCEGQRWTIFISLLLMGPKNRVLCWPSVQSAHLAHTHTHPFWRHISQTASLFLDAPKINWKVLFC